MKYLAAFFLLIFTFSCSHSPTVNKVSLSGETHSISPVFMGVNGNLMAFDQPWSNPGLIRAFKKLGTPLLRYPAGTIGNYWDWEKGGLDESVAEKDMIKWVVAQNLHKSPKRYKLENLAKIVNSGTTPIFMLNMLTKDLEHALNGLRTADSLGMPVKYVELGNELYFNLPLESHVYPTPEDYGRTCREWISAIKKEFPEAKCAILGSNRNVKARDTNWTQRALSTCTNADAVIFHQYAPMGIDGQKEKRNATAGEEGKSDIRKGPEDIAGHQKWELNLLKDPYAYGNIIGTASHAAGKVSELNVPEDMEIWVTEFNVRDDNGALRGTWANTMALAAWYRVFLDHQQVKLTNYHNLIGGTFPAIYTNRNGFSHIKHQKLASEPWSFSASGVLLHILTNVLNGATSTEKLTFSSNIRLKNDAGETFEGLNGWVFRNGEKMTGLIFNISNAPMEVDLTDLPENYTARQYVSTLENYIFGMKSLEIFEVKNSSKIKLSPFSITSFSFN